MCRDKEVPSMVRGQELTTSIRRQRTREGRRVQHVIRKASSVEQVAVEGIHSREEVEIADAVQSTQAATAHVVRWQQEFMIGGIVGYKGLREMVGGGVSRI